MIASQRWALCCRSTFVVFGILILQWYGQTLAACPDCIATAGQAWCEYRQRCASTSVAARQHCWSGPATNVSDAWRTTACPVEYPFATCASTTYAMVPSDRTGTITLSPPGVPYLSMLNCTWFISPEPADAFNSSALVYYGGTGFKLDGRSLGAGDVMALYDLQLPGQVRYDLPNYGGVLLFSVQGPSPQMVTQATVSDCVAIAWQQS